MKKEIEHMKIVKYYSEQEIDSALLNSYERNQFNSSYFWSYLKKSEL